MRRSLSLSAALWLALSAPVLAASANEAFKDVPSNCWASNAVMEMAVKRSLMNVYPDGTFRGNQPFTRAQLADSLDALVTELEALSNTPWEDGAPYKWPLEDVSTANPDHDRIFKMVNDYHLWKDVPTVDPYHFHPDQTVTREEVAQVVRNLLSTGEAERAVLPRDPRTPSNPFKDLSPAQWAYKAILADDSRYRVMIGFPDVTFQPGSTLTRYQYAAIGAQTFGIIRELVRKTREEEQNLEPLAAMDLFQGVRHFDFGLEGGSADAPAGDVQGGLMGRGIWYPGNQFLMVDGQIDYGNGGLNGNAGLYWSPFNWNTSTWEIQPFVGARYNSVGTTVSGVPGFLFYNSHAFGSVGFDTFLDVPLGDSLQASAFAGQVEIKPGIEIPLGSSTALQVGLLGQIGFAPRADFVGGANVGLSF